jgi:DNA-directed RNA polymerase subunit M/transcription elongation factor TFIIS
MELKFCEHCGSILLVIQERINCFYVVCKTCGDCGTIEDSEDEAIQAWNDGKRLNPKMKIFL